MRTRISVLLSLLVIIVLAGCRNAAPEEIYMPPSDSEPVAEKAPVPEEEAQGASEDQVSDVELKPQDLAGRWKIHSVRDNTRSYEADALISFQGDRVLANAGCKQHQSIWEVTEPGAVVFKDVPGLSGSTLMDCMHDSQEAAAVDMLLGRLLSGTATYQIFITEEELPRITIRNGDILLSGKLSEANPTPDITGAWNLRGFSTTVPDAQEGEASVVHSVLLQSPDLIIEPWGTFKTSGFCNGITGAWEVSGDTVRFTRVVTDQVPCEDASDARNDEKLRELLVGTAQYAHYEVNGLIGVMMDEGPVEALRLTTADGALFADFHRVPQPTQTQP